MGRDYDSAVMAGGYCGFMLGTTANAMACMDVLARKHGPAPRAFLVVLARRSLPHRLRQRAGDHSHG
jgi:sodium--glutamate symport carrier gltS